MKAAVEDLQLKQSLLQSPLFQKPKLATMKVNIKSVCMGTAQNEPPIIIDLTLLRSCQQSIIARHI